MYESGANDHTVLLASSVTITQPRTVEITTPVRFFSEAKASATVRYSMSVFSTSGNGPRGNSCAIAETAAKSVKKKGGHRVVEYRAIIEVIASRATTIAYRRRRATASWRSFQDRECPVLAGLGRFAYSNAHE